MFDSPTYSRCLYPITETLLMPRKLQHESVFVGPRIDLTSRWPFQDIKGVKLCCNFKADRKGEKNGVFRRLTPEILSGSWTGSLRIGRKIGCLFGVRQLVGALVLDLKTSFTK